MEEFTNGHMIFDCELEMWLYYSNGKFYTDAIFHPPVTYLWFIYEGYPLVYTPKG